MSSVIKVENLSKKYVISHQKQERYTALRDVITSGAKEILGNLYGKKQPLKSIEKEDFWALKDINFEIQQGDRVGIIGRNGAGKTTLLKILSRITEPTSGKISIKGRVASLLEVGTGFHPELTGRENIYLNGAISGMSRAEIKSRFDEIVAFAEVERFLDTPVKRYSSGMYVRLAFSVSAHLESEVLIVDEVLAVGDAQFQKKCLGKMEQVGDQGRTVLFVSHNLGSIRALCTSAVLLDNGAVDLQGELGMVISKYTSSNNSMNHVFNPVNQVIIRNESAIVNKVEVLDRFNKKIELIDTDTSFNVVISFETLRDDVSVGFNLIVYDGENNIVFGSLNNHEPLWYGKPMMKGSYKSTCQITGGFFNNGMYRIKIVLLGKGFSDPIISDELLNIQIEDGVLVRGDYYGVYGGNTRPLFEWTTEKG